MSPLAFLLDRRDRFEADGRFAAIVLAGTYGWGDADVPHFPPRSLAEIVFEPVISYPLQWLRAGGAARAVVCANGSAGALRARLGTSHHGLTLTYAADRFPRGPAGCLRDAAAMVNGDQVVVVESTVIPTCNLGELLRAHRDSGAALTVVTAPMVRGDEPGPAGIYVVDRRAVDHVAAAGFQDIKEGMIPQLARTGSRVAAFASPEPCPRVGDLDSYLHVNQWMVERLVSTTESAAVQRWVRRGEHLTHPSAVVHPSALLMGPTVIGPGAQVGADATIVGPTVIGTDAIVAAGAQVSRSVVGPGSFVASQAMVHQCVLAAGSFIEPGAHLHHTAPERARSRRALPRREWDAAARPELDDASRPATVLPIRAARPLHVAATRGDGLSKEEVIGA